MCRFYITECSEKTKKIWKTEKYEKQKQISLVTAETLYII